MAVQNEVTNPTNEEVNLTDYLNEFLDDDSGGSDVQENASQDKPYTKQDENLARAKAMQEINDKKARELLTNANNKERATLKTQIKAQEDKIKELENKLLGITSKVDTFGKTTQDVSDRFIGMDIEDEERKIMDDPILGKYYDQAKVRSHFNKLAIDEKRYLSPYESCAVLNFADVARRLAQYEERDKSRQEMLNNNLGGASYLGKNEDGLDKVQDIESAMREARRRARNMYGN